MPRTDTMIATSIRLWPETLDEVKAQADKIDREAAWLMRDIIEKAMEKAKKGKSF